MILFFVFLDIANIGILRDLVYSFLLSKRNSKGAKKIHRIQSGRHKLTLSYIKHYTIYPKAFKRFYLLYLSYMASIIPQYAFIVIIFFMSKTAFNYALYSLLIIKVVLFFIIASNFSSKISRFDKRYRKRYRK